MPQVTRLIADFAVDMRLKDVSGAGLDVAKTIMLDTIGVTIAGARTSPGAIMADYVESMGASGRARIIGTSISTAPALAALANGTSAHALDFDDRGHFSAHCLPGALAVAEHCGASGASLMRAFVAAREVAQRITQAFDAGRANGVGPTYRGWYSVGLVSPLASAVAASMLLELDANKTATALGIAAANASGVRRNQGTMAKALNAGSAHHGVQAAFLARAGFTGDPEILEAPLGLFAALCAPGELDLSPLTEHLGAPFALEAGADIKPYPACTPAHAVIKAALELRSHYKFDASDVASIETDLKRWSMFRTTPHNECEAGFCLPYLVAVALIAGRFGVEHLFEPYLSDPGVADLMARTRESANRGDGLAIRLKDGRVLHRPLSPSVIGSAPSLAGDEIMAKFRECVVPTVGEDGCEALRDQLACLEFLPDVRALRLTG